MNVATIRAALATALTAGATPALQSVAANRHQSLANFPAGVISIDTITPETQGDTAYDLAGHVDVLVSEAAADEAWAQLDALLSSNTLADALRATAFTVQYQQIGAEFEHDKRRYIGFVLAFTVLG